MITGPEPNLAAILAAAQANEAAVELLRFAREGSFSERAPFFEVEPVHKLAEALKLAIAIQLAGDTTLDDDERAQLACIGADLGQFIEGWVA